MVADWKAPCSRAHCGSRRRASRPQLRPPCSLTIVPRKPGPTVEAAITEHIELLTGVGADTPSHYRGQLRTHIAPGLGALPVPAVTYRHVAGWVRAMTEKGLSPKTIANVHGLLSAAMTTAVRLG